MAEPKNKKSGLKTKQAYLVVPNDLCTVRNTARDKRYVPLKQLLGIGSESFFPPFFCKGPLVFCDYS